MDRKKLQKQRNLMIISGIGIIAFAFWDMIEFISYMIFGDRFMEEVLADLESELRIWVYVLMFCYYLVALLLKLYVGRSAIREGRGGKGGNFYIVVCVLLCGDTIWDIENALRVFQLSYVYQRVMGIVVYVFLSFFLLQLIRSVYLVRKNS